MFIPWNHHMEFAFKYGILELLFEYGILEFSFE